MGERNRGSRPDEPGHPSGPTERRGLWQALTSDEGPEFKVPRLVWQIVYGLVLLAGLALLVAADPFPVEDDLFAPEPPLREYFVRGLVIAVYVAGWQGGTRSLLNWLFGALPAKRDRNPLDRWRDGGQDDWR